MSRPNIVLFMLDQLSAKWIEQPASAAVPTPNIDRLRRMGTNFRRAFTSNPLCCPARATLATGLTTRAHGVLQNGYELDPSLPTFMRNLQQAGWQTGAFGKLHFRVHFHGLHTDYREYGFDVVHNTEDGRAGEWVDWVASKHPEHLDNVLRTIWATEIPELSHYGPEGIDLAQRIRDLRKGHKWATPDRPDQTGFYYVLPYPEPVSQTNWITERALDFIQGADPARPILAQVSYVQPHSPFTPPQEWWDAVDPSAIPEPVAPEWADDALAPECFRTSEGATPSTPPNWRHIRHHYFADVAHLDAQLGRVIEALQQTGRWENTYIMLLADHGELLLDHGFTGKAERHYDASVRIPLMIAGPGLQAGLTRDEFVELEDLYPTIMELAGLSVPPLPTMGPYLREPAPALPGRSLVGLCRGEPAGGWRSSVYIESFNNIYWTNPREWARTIRNERYRYTLYPCGAGEQLFDLLADPDETRNLAGDPAAAEMRRQMRDALLEAVILQDYPHSPRSLYALGVH